MQRDVIVNLMHHLDHPNPRETSRRVAKEYYWQKMKKDVENFARSSAVQVQVQVTCFVLLPFSNIIVNGNETMKYAKVAH